LGSHQLSLINEPHTILQCLKLSGFAAQVLADAKLLDFSNLDPHRKTFLGPLIGAYIAVENIGTKEYDTRKEVSNPVTGGASAIYWTVTHWYGGIAQIF
jgi:hypothetical protein